MGRSILVLDGHDGAGKSTLAGLLANHVGGIHIPPFSGTLGDHISWLWKQGKFERCLALGREAIERALSEMPENVACVFDRHWLCLFTVLPDHLRIQWLDLPPTVLCWCNPEETMRRLSERGEAPVSQRIHDHYCKLYMELARIHKVPVLDTSSRSVNESFSELIKIPQVAEFSKPNNLSK